MIFDELPDFRLSYTTDCPRCKIVLWKSVKSVSTLENLKAFTIQHDLNTVCHHCAKDVPLNHITLFIHWSLNCDLLYHNTPIAGFQFDWTKIENAYAEWLTRIAGSKYYRDRDLQLERERKASIVPVKNAPEFVMAYSAMCPTCQAPIDWQDLEVETMEDLKRVGLRAEPIDVICPRCDAHKVADTAYLMLFVSPEIIEIVEPTPLEEFQFDWTRIETLYDGAMTHMKKLGRLGGYRLRRGSRVLTAEEL